MPEKKTATAATTNRLWNLGKVLKSIFKVKNIKKQNLCHETEQNITLPTFDNLDLHIQQVDRNKLNIFPKLLGERKIRFHFSFNLCFIFIFLIFFLKLTRYTHVFFRLKFFLWKGLLTIKIRTNLIYQIFGYNIFYLETRGNLSHLCS